MEASTVAARAVGHANTTRFPRRLHPSTICLTVYVLPVLRSGLASGLGLGLGLMLGLGLGLGLDRARPACARTSSEHE